MLKTQEEAGKCQCIQAIAANGWGINCEGSICMAWRWASQKQCAGTTCQCLSVSDCQDCSDRRGYCGLAGRPEE